LAALVLTAARHDSLISLVRLRTQQAPIPGIDVDNSGYPIERSACLTIAIGPAAAAECGNLRVVHPLPSVRTLNKIRTPTLLYNSEFAHPYFIAPVQVKLTSTTTTPDSVEVVLYLNINGSNVERARRRWAGSEWPASQTTTRRVTIACDCVNDTTGYYVYNVEVANLYPGGVRLAAALVGGKSFLLNRKASYFGAGWWLAGLERLLNQTPTAAEIAWFGGDGSARFFVKHGTLPNTWYTPVYERSDTLYYDPGTLKWTKTDVGGVRTKFNSSGRHIQTIDRFGRTTTFSYSVDTLKTITLPPNNLTYQFAYTTGRLSSVTAPPIGAITRVTQVTNVSGNVTAIRNPGDSAVTFGYETASSDQYRMDKRTNRRGVVDTFTVDSARRVTSSRIKMGGGSIPDIVWVHVPGETRGLPKSGTPSSVDTARVFTKIDGPRTDVVDTSAIYQSRFGPPRRIIDALSNETRVLSGPYFFGTVYGWTPLRTQYPTGRVLLAEYDNDQIGSFGGSGRGNLIRLIDSVTAVAGQRDTTRYEWDGKFDQMTKTVPPERDSVVFFVSALNGRRDSLKDARGDSSIVKFGYDAQNQVSSMTLPPVAGMTAVYTYTYDPTRRNLATVTTPRGFVTEYQTDAIGRDTLTITRIDTLASSTARVYRRLVYDLRDLVIRDTTRTVSVSPSQMVIAVHTYDAEGSLLATKDTTQTDLGGIGAVLHQWRYDTAGRVVATVAPDNQVDSTEYDPAGNPITSVSRRYPNVGVIRMQYDALNRLATRVLPQVSFSYPASQITGGTQINQLPYQYSAVVDTQSFNYAADGQPIQAANQNATVRRGYDVTGRLQADTLQVKTADRSGFGTHTYITTYTYDRDGRRTNMTAPALFTGPSITYGYHSQSGTLVTISDIGSNAFTLAYDARGQLRSILHGVTSITRRLGYDADARLVADAVTNTGGTTFPRFPAQPLRQLRLARNVQGQILMGRDPASFFQDTLAATYSGLGILVGGFLTQKGQDAVGGNPATYWSGDNWSPDPLARVLSFTTRDTLYTQSGKSGGEESGSLVYQTGTGRLVARHVGATDTLTYDASGNITFNARLTTQERAAYYGADGRLLASDSRVAGRRIFEEYRYDALGRRVWVRQLTVCQGQQSGLTCVSPFTRRIVWDGAQMLAEIQAPYDTLNATVEEQDGGWSVRPLVNGLDPNPYYGKAVYAPGLDTDEPFSVTRYEYRDNPQGSSLTWPTFRSCPASCRNLIG